MFALDFRRRKWDEKGESRALQRFYELGSDCNPSGLDLFQGVVV